MNHHHTLPDNTADRPFEVDDARNPSRLTAGHRRSFVIGGIAIAGALAISACGSDDSPADAGTSPSTPATEAPAPAAATAPAAAATAGETELGETLVGERGLTLYGFTNDVDATSTCYGTCAEAWPPVIVGSDWTVAPDLDAGIFATTVRDDGQLQLVAGKWPLYYFAGDVSPGEINGQGSGDVWFAAGIDGSLLGIDGAPAAEDQDGHDASDSADATDTNGGDPYGTGGDDDQVADAAAPQLVSVAPTEVGDALVDANGLTLYGFTEDADGVPTCFDACADAWPPLIVDGDAVPAGLDEAVFSVVERGDGMFQLKAGAWPLYTFAGDAAPGDINGQESGGVWFVTAPDGSLIKG